jgi:nucleoside-diphosphate-sugar epimerase
VVMGDPRQSRDFLHVNDAVRACGLALAREVTGAVNIGSGTSVTIDQLARLTLQLAGLSIEPEARPDPRSNVRVKLDTGRAERELGFKAAIPLATGLSGLLEFERLHCGTIT